VGNLSHSIEETDLTYEFLQFGDLDSVAFQPGRSYAFVNFNKEEDAIAAIKSLQGYPLAGNPLRIEFAKAVSFCHFCSPFYFLDFRFLGILLCFCICAKWVVFML
jgi:RNA recognition motif-containing protein